VIKPTEKKFLATKKIFIWLVAALLIISYIIWGVANLFAPPKITIEEPNDNYITNEKIITVKGHVSEKSLVMINGQTISLDDKNSFEEKITLIPGVNLIKISAKKKIGAESVFQRQVIVR
jgi:hypothetical protein